MKNKLKQIVGYDNNGVLYDAGNHIIRKIFPCYVDEAKNIINIYKKYSLVNQGIVQTEYAEDNRTLKHEKHIISYPYEWTTNMYKDAVLFHLELFLELDKYDLTLKDALPNNILFDNSNFIFIDFLSIVSKNKLKEEKWLIQDSSYKDERFVVIEKMLVPFMLVPFLAMHIKKYSLARNMLSEQACNCKGRIPIWRDLYLNKSNINNTKTIIKNIIKSIIYYSRVPIYNKKIAKIMKIIKLANKIKYNDFISKLLEFVKMVDVGPDKSAYVSYYKDKDKDSDIREQSSWCKKQINVYKVLNDIRPKSLLDIGANTGWFSIIAEKIGAKVVATDIDESSIDSLYLYTKKYKLNILPLLLSFDDLVREIYGMVETDPIYSDRDYESQPLFIKATKRLNSEGVLCLGLLHHLVLGLGKNIKEVFYILSSLSKNFLILEYIDIEDELIKSEPSFFSNICKYSKNNYNIDLVKKVGKEYFSDLEILESNPSTRKLIVFKK